MKTLGAKDPSLITLLQEHFYRPYLEGIRGIAKIRSLLRSGENPNQATANGAGILQIVIKSKSDRLRKLELLKLLIEHGADTHKIDKSGLSPLQLAKKMNHTEIALFLSSKDARF